jgi:hypothetical protein
MLGDAIPAVILSKVLASLGVAYESPKLHEPTDLLTTAHAYSSRQPSTWVQESSIEHINGIFSRPSFDGL